MLSRDLSPDHQRLLLRLNHRFTLDRLTHLSDPQLSNVTGPVRPLDRGAFLHADQSRSDQSHHGQAIFFKVGLARPDQFYGATGAGAFVYEFDAGAHGHDMRGKLITPVNYRAIDLFEKLRGHVRGASFSGHRQFRQGIGFAIDKMNFRLFAGD